MQRGYFVVVLFAAGLTGCAGSIAGGSGGSTAVTPEAAPLGLSVNVHMAPTLLSDENNEWTGSGVGGSIGYGFGPRASIYAGIDVASMEIDEEFSEGEGTADLTHLDVGLRYSFDKPGRRFVPYVFAAVTSRSLVSEFCDDFLGCMEAETSGIGYTFGPGLRVFLGDSFGLDAGWGLTFGNFTEGSVDGEEIPDFEETGAVSGRFMLGAAWYPSRSGGGDTGGGRGPLK